MYEPSCKTCAWVIANSQTVDRSKTYAAWAQIVGVGHSSIGRHFDHSAKPTPGQNIQAGSPGDSYKWEFSESSFDGNSPATDKELSSNDVEKFLIEKGLNPDEWDYQFRFSEWEQHSQKTGTRMLHAFRVSGKRKGGKDDRKWEQAYIDRIHSFKAVKIDSTASKESFVVVPTDFQIGKVDWNGGSSQTVEQVMASFHKAADYCREHKPAEIVIIDAGDIVENIYNTSSQLGTNDLGLPSQVSVAYELMLAGIQLLAPLAPSIKYVAVTSNHGTHRLGPKSTAGAVHEDCGILLAKILKTSAKLAPALAHLEVILPENYTESLAFETSGTVIGVVHGHQAAGPDKLGEWWARQTHGNMPVAPARILVTGHWHSFRVYQSGDARWVFVGPASDRGSSWFTNARGEQSQSGMLAFKTSNNVWSDIQIL